MTDSRNYPDVPLERLIIDDPPLPARWNGPRGREPIDWAVSVHSLPTSRLSCEDGQELKHAWAQGGMVGNRPEVGLFVCKHPTARKASARYRDTSTRAALGEDYPNFDFNAPSEDIYLDLEMVGTLGADKFEVVCAAGSAQEDDCVVWMYRGRYGQYIIRLFAWASGGTMEMAPFMRLVGAVDQHTLRELGEASPAAG